MTEKNDVTRLSNGVLGVDQQAMDLPASMRQLQFPDGSCGRWRIHSVGDGVIEFTTRQPVQQLVDFSVGISTSSSPALRAGASVAA
jgi:hypothetical protein